MAGTEFDINVCFQVMLTRRRRSCRDKTHGSTENPETQTQKESYYGQAKGLYVNRAVGRHCHHCIIDGGIDVDQELDVHLSTLLGTSLGLWENMQKNHDETKK